MAASTESLPSSKTRMDETKARRLLRHCGWAGVVSIASLLAYIIIKQLPPWINRDVVFVAAVAVWFVCGIYFYVCLGRLAHGLRQSAALWIVCTWLATGIFAYVVGRVAIPAFGMAIVWGAAWARMRSLVHRAFATSVSTAS